MLVYYNEIDKKKCAYISQLMKDGHINKGHIDDRSIRDVQPDELKEYTRCHFFAGIGLWDHALNLAGWQENNPVWTGSCPCQPYSTAGRQKAQADDRHLWPEWLRLIRECKPTAVFGEQVAAAITHGWLDDVYQGLESEGYAVGSAVLPACGVGAPHRRERLWFVGYSKYNGSFATKKQGSNRQTIQCSQEGKNGSSECKGTGNREFVANGENNRFERWKATAWKAGGDGIKSNFCNVENTSRGRCSESEEGEIQQQGGARIIRGSDSFWENGKWIECPDGKQRLIEPGIPLLASYGDKERVGIIHAAGDAIVAQLAAEFIKASM